jgi:aspartate carbamoyltransferase regulatory subunit
MENQLLVRKIENGTVIDHIPAWRSEMVLKLLGIEKIRTKADISMVSLNNVPSRKHGRKDIIKVNNYYLEEGDADLVCLVYPTATINYIEDWETRKYMPKTPERVFGKIRCPEVSCITNSPREPISTRFRVLPEFKALQCEYCDSFLDFKDMPEYVKNK